MSPSDPRRVGPAQDRRDGDPTADGTGPPALLGPFVAWMATQSLEESTRRQHREAVEAFFAWCHTDKGPASGRRSRYERHLGRHAPDRLTTARAGLDQFAQYRELVARTLPLDR